MNKNKTIFNDTIRFDSHLHSSFSADSETPARRQIEQALSLGLDGLCFTEHCDQDYPPEEGLDFRIDFERYFEQLQLLRQEYGDRLRIGIGMEFGIQAHLGDALARLTGRYPFDLIIASQHILNGRDPYYPAYFEGRSEQECYEEFLLAQYETIKKMPLSGFDTLGHMDYIVRYGPNKNRCYSYEAYADCIEPTLRYLIENGKCLEVNTGGLKYGLGQTNPGTAVLRRYHDLGGELLTIGSDAHEPQYLAYEFDRTAQLLRELGFKWYTVFEQRRGRQIRL